MESQNNSGVDIAKEFVELMELQKNLNYIKREVPVPTKIEAWKEFRFNILAFLGRMLLSPLEMFCVFVIAWGSYGGTFLKAIPLSIIFTFGDIWSSTIGESIITFKRAYGLDKEPVYTWDVRPGSPHSNIFRTTDEILDEVVKLIR